MNTIRRASAAAVVAAILVALAPVLAKTIDFDAATIADINARVRRRHADGGKAGADVPGAHRRPTTARGRRCTR